MRRGVVLLLAAAGLAGCGGAHDEKVVAHVGNAVVTDEQLDQTTEYFRDEAAREGRPFAADRSARKQLLGLLVHRAQIEQGAAALGITISRDAVERRLQSAATEEEDAQAFLESSVRTQLLTEAVYGKLAARIHDADPQQRQVRRNAALQAWLAALPKRYPAR
jgi:parvulin-like peptidyl-prolyl isomerase